MFLVEFGERGLEVAEMLEQEALGGGPHVEVLLGEIGELLGVGGLDLLEGFEAIQDVGAIHLGVEPHDGQLARDVVPIVGVGFEQMSQ